MKKTVLHIIDYLGRGGAEVMLVKVIKELKEYNNIVVTLNPQNHFGDEFTCDEYYCLEMGSFLKFPLAVLKLRKFIKNKKIDIVHSHLFSSTLVARFAVPGSIPLVTTIHTNVTSSTEYKKWYLKTLEYISYQFHKTVIIGVSGNVLEQYFRFVKHKPFKKYLLYTFVDVDQIDAVPAFDTGVDQAKFTLIAIGALRYPKNQQYLVQAFERLKNENFELHIYGMGAMQAALEHAIKASGANVMLKGEVKNVSGLIPQYDLYVMSSLFEGFSLSVLEAMVMEVPMLLSDIPSFREQCADTAVYFDLNNMDDFVFKLKQMANDKHLLNNLAIAAKERAYSNFTLAHHMIGLRKIYAETLNDR